MTLTTYMQIASALVGFLLGCSVAYYHSRRRARRRLRENYVRLSVLHGQVESLETRLRQLLANQSGERQAARQSSFKAWDGFLIPSQDSSNRFEPILDRTAEAAKH